MVLGLGNLGLKDQHLPVLLTTFQWLGAYMKDFKSHLSFRSGFQLKKQTDRAQQVFKNHIMSTEHGNYVGSKNIINYPIHTSLQL